MTKRWIQLGCGCRLNLIAKDDDVAYFREMHVCLSCKSQGITKYNSYKMSAEYARELEYTGIVVILNEI